MFLGLAAKTMLYIFLRVAHLQVSELIPTQLHPNQLKNLIPLLFLKCTEDLGEKNHEQKSFGKPNAHCLSPRRPILDSTAQCVHFQKLSEKGSLGLVVKTSALILRSFIMGLFKGMEEQKIQCTDNGAGKAKDDGFILK